MTVPEGVAHVPPFVDHRVRPAIGAQLGQLLRIGPEIGFINGEAVGIPAIPSQGRRGAASRANVAKVLHSKATASTALSAHILSDSC
jgi:hypothetical protein